MALYSLFSAQASNGSGATFFPVYGQYVLAQVDLNSVTTATVTIEGRILPNAPWVPLFQVTEATAVGARAGVVARFDQMRATLANLSGGGANVTVTLSETDQRKP
jgi:hypothetical protein